MCTYVTNSYFGRSVFDRDLRIFHLAFHLFKNFQIILIRYCQNGCIFQNESKKFKKMLSPVFKHLSKIRKFSDLKGDCQHLFINQ